jgi:hypothetical protein
MRKIHVGLAFSIDKRLTLLRRTDAQSAPVAQADPKLYRLLS